LYRLQVKRYDLVIQLSEEGAALGARDIRNASRDTMKEFEQDMALATALAQVSGSVGAERCVVCRQAGIWECQPCSKHELRHFADPSRLPWPCLSLCSAAWLTARFATASPRWPAPASKRPFIC
jgi:hypothetical protein